MLIRYCFASLLLIGGCGPTVLVETVDGTGAGGSGGASSSASSSSASSSGGGPIQCHGGWGHVIGGPKSDRVMGQAIGPDGSVFLTVNHMGELKVDGVPLDLPPNVGYALLKFQPDGLLAWAKGFGGSTQIPPFPVAMTSKGDIVIGTSFFAQLDLGNGNVLTQPGTAGFVASFSSDGDLHWAQSFPVQGEAAAVVNLVVDATDNIYFTTGGYTDKPFVLGNLEAKGSPLLVKLGTDGAVHWMQGFTGGTIEDLATTSQGSVVMTGSFTETVNYGGNQLISAGGFDLFHAALSGDGQHLESRRYGDASHQFARLGVMYPDGSRSIGGSFTGTLDFDGVAIQTDKTSAFVTHFDANGKPLWARTMGGNVAALVAMTATPDGGLFMTGNPFGNYDFGCGAGVAPTNVSELHSIQFDATGHCIEDTALGAAIELFAFGVGIDPFGRRVMSGYFAGGAFDVGQGATEAAIRDGFVRVFSTCPVDQ